MQETVENTFFPINLYFDDDLADSIKAQVFTKLENDALNSRYRYQLSSDYRMEVWDNETCTRICMQLWETYETYRPKCYFKGMELESNSSFYRKGIKYVVDFYGLNTKKSLTLDRKKIRDEARHDVEKIIQSAIMFYLTTIKSDLFLEDKNRDNGEYNLIYTYWCIVPLKEKQELLESYKNLFQYVNVQIDVLTKVNSEDGFEVKQLNFESLMSDLEQTAFIWNLTDYIELKGVKESVNSEELLTLIGKKSVSIPFSTIVIDKNFSEILRKEPQSKIMIISDKKRRVYLETYTTEKNVLPETADQMTKEYLLGSLVEKNDSESYYTLHRGAIRRFMLGLKKYEKICTTCVPFGVDGDSHWGVGYIISPITVEQWEQNRHLEKKAFIDKICADAAFTLLVDNVYQHPLHKDQYTKTQIEEAYREFVEVLYNRDAAVEMAQEDNE